MSPNATRNGRLLLATGCAIAAAAIAGALRADLMVSHSFGKVFGAQRTTQPFDSTTTGGPQQSAQVGDEGYWLTRAEVESPVAFAKQIAIGDRITISGRDGRQRILEVVDLKGIGEPITKAVNGASPSLRLLLVTCRIVDGSDREARSPVRFIIEGEAVEPTATQSLAQPKTL